MNNEMTVSPRVEPENSETNIEINIAFALLPSRNTNGGGMITKFERWMLKRIFSRIVQQSPNHMKNIQEVYRLLDQEVKNQFYEDNDATRRAYLTEQFEEGKA